MIKKLIKNIYFKYALATLLVVIISFSIPLKRTFSKHAPTMYLANCAVLNEKSELLFDITGQLCDFLPDGRMVVFQKDMGAVKERLYLYDSHQQIIWSKDLDLHHVLKFSEDKRNIFLLSYEHHQFLGSPFVFDVISKLDLNGVEVARFNTYDIKDDLSKACSPYPRPYNMSDTPGVKEFTHLNSLYEIPENPKSQKFPWMKKGNIVVNMLGLNVIAIFDPQLKLLKTLPYSKDCFGIYHDAQILPSGDLLVFRNIFELDLDKSDVVIMDIETGEIKRRAMVPYSAIRGSVQLLKNNHLLISESSKGGRAFELDENGKMVLEITNPNNNRHTNQPVVFQIFRYREDLKDFLSKQF